MAIEVALDGNATSHCGPNALTDSFGWFIQFLLAGLAFASLISESTPLAAFTVRGPQRPDGQRRVKSWHRRGGATGGQGDLLHKTQCGVVAGLGLKFQPAVQLYYNSVHLLGF